MKIWIKLFADSLQTVDITRVLSNPIMDISTKISNTIGATNQEGGYTTDCKEKVEYNWNHQNDNGAVTKPRSSRWLRQISEIVR